MSGGSTLGDRSTLEGLVAARLWFPPVMLDFVGIVSAPRGRISVRHRAHGPRSARSGPGGSASLCDPMWVANPSGITPCLVPEARSHVASYRKARWDEIGVKRNALVQDATEALSWSAR